MTEGAEGSGSFQTLVVISMSLRITALLNRHVWVKQKEEEEEEEEEERGCCDSFRWRWQSNFSPITTTEIAVDALFVFLNAFWFSSSGKNKKIWADGKALI